MQVHFKHTNASNIYSALQDISCNSEHNANASVIATTTKDIQHVWYIHDKNHFAIVPL